jgi:carboxypeptidase C (cathepsin A)
MRRAASGLLLAAGLALSGPPAFAQHPDAAAHAAKTEEAKPAPRPIPRLPANSLTHHTLDLAGRKLEIAATAGAVTLSNGEGVAQAQIGFIAYARAEMPPEQRPVTFVLNGGPGSASAWLQLGLLGPWRLRMDADAARPSADAAPVANDDTWLDFTDLVFIDPVGTGFSKLLVNNDENRKKYFSVGGDIASISEAIRLWLAQNKRMSSPKFIVGESYGGFRGPRLVRQLEDDEGVGVRGLALISPLLDFGNRSAALAVIDWAEQLPSLVAAERAKKAPVSRADMKDVEDYAQTDYVVDLLRGEDPAALARRKAKLASLTGLDPALLDLRHGKINDQEYLREANRGQAAVASYYDATVFKPDPFPERQHSIHDDSMTDALKAPFSSAVYDLYARKLNWLPEGARYRLSNAGVFKAWDFGNHWLKPESLSELRQALAEDPKLRVLIAHGLFDLVTPYFATKLELDQIPTSVGRDRVEFQVLPGGHMFYSRDASRQALRKAAEKLYGP